MPILRQLLAVLLMLLTIATGSAVADERHVIDPSQLAAAMRQHVGAQDTDRAAVREALARPDVQRVAASIGIDLNRVTSSVDTLSGRELQQAAMTARQINQSLVGGASSISTTTIIILLLILIVLILALK
ncbi:MAG: hypothetical protein DMF90_14240 [Acidobacteria bacterium]|nr:MAG: hypothetical protein DMF90_14240 [Acidobacteriota bacterium]